MNDFVVWLLLIAGYIAVIRWVLPRFGVPT
jgi:hypothetical protein